MFAVFGIAAERDHINPSFGEIVDGWTMICSQMERQLHLGHGKLPLVGEGEGLGLLDTGDLGLVEGKSWIHNSGH